MIGIREHALLYAHIAKAVLEGCGKEKGEQLIQKITVAYGVKRGQRMRAKALASGEEADLSAYLAHGEWQGKPGENISAMSYRTDATVSSVSRCAWHDTWRKAGMEEYGKYYCRYIDRALAAGFDGSFSLQIPHSMGRGDDCCEFVWTQAADEKSVSVLRERLGAGRILPFSFHCHELAECAVKVLEQEGLSAPADTVRKAYEKLTGASFQE
jgi:hypothetical protein